jgi:hypothetical protein
MHISYQGTDSRHPSMSHLIHVLQPNRNRAMADADSHAQISLEARSENTPYASILGLEAGGAGGACISWYWRRRSVGVIVRTEMGALGPHATLAYSYPSIDTWAAISIATIPDRSCSAEYNTGRKDKANNWVIHDSLTYGENLQVVGCTILNNVVTCEPYQKARLKMPCSFDVIYS